MVRGNVVADPVRPVHEREVVADVVLARGGIEAARALEEIDVADAGVDRIADPDLHGRRGNDTRRCDGARRHGQPGVGSHERDLVVGVERRIGSGPTKVLESAYSR
jgi:hypothetical protein